MFKEFREFILRGNLVDLAVAVVIGTAFATVVTALVTDLITPLIAAVVSFLVIKPVNALMARFQPAPAVDIKTRPCPECISDIPVSARRCAFCTTVVTPPA